MTPGDQPGSHGYNMAPGGRLAFHTLSRFDAPPRIDVVELPSHRSLRPLTDPSALQAAIAPIVNPPVEFFTVDVGDGVTLDGWMLKPSQFDPSRKYPVIVFVYGEPGSQTVVDRWGGATMLFHRALAEAGYVVVSFDNRGTPAPKGAAWRKVVYGSVGELSSKEQAAAIRALAARHSFVDTARIGIWGWSGGGSNTLNAMFRFPDVYKVGVSVAPVPDQQLYDTIYQERYMGLPKDNAEGYKRGSPINFAEGLKGKLLHRPRIRRRQRALPGHRAAGEPARRARQAVRLDGLPESHALDLRRAGHHAARLSADRALLRRASAAGRAVAALWAGTVLLVP